HRRRHAQWRPPRRALDAGWAGARALQGKQTGSGSHGPRRSAARAGRRHREPDVPGRGRRRQAHPDGCGDPRLPRRPPAGVRGHGHERDRRRRCRRRRASRSRARPARATRRLVIGSETRIERSGIDLVIERAQGWFEREQYPEGYWWAELESNATMDAEYLLLTHFLGARSEEHWRGVAQDIRNY